MKESSTHPNAPTKAIQPRQRWRLWAARLAWLGACLLLLAAMALGMSAWLSYQLHHGETIASLLEWSAQVRRAGILLQLVLMTVLVWRWARCLQWLARKGWIKTDSLPPLLAWRWKAAMFMLMYWLLIPVGLGNWLARLQT